MIDEKGKLFGKINIIDLIVIIVIIAAVAMFGVSRLAKRGDAENTELAGKEIYMVFYADEVPDYVTDKLEKGSKVYDVDTKTELGEVVSFEVGPAESYGTNSAGESVKTSRDTYRSVKITAKIDGKINDYGVTVNDIQYGVGHSLTIRAGYAKIWLKVYDIYLK